MALIFHFTCKLKCHLQSVSIWTSLKILSSGNGLIVSNLAKFEINIFNNSRDIIGCQSFCRVTTKTEDELRHDKSGDAYDAGLRQ